MAILKGHEPVRRSIEKNRIAAKLRARRHRWLFNPGVDDDWKRRESEWLKIMWITNTEPCRWVLVA